MKAWCALVGQAGRCAVLAVAVQREVQVSRCVWSAGRSAQDWGRTEVWGCGWGSRDVWRADGSSGRERHASGGCRRQQGVGAHGAVSRERRGRNRRKGRGARRVAAAPPRPHPSREGVGGMCRGGWLPGAQRRARGRGGGYAHSKKEGMVKDVQTLDGVVQGMLQSSRMDERVFSKGLVGEKEGAGLQGAGPGGLWARRGAPQHHQMVVSRCPSRTPAPLPSIWLNPRGSA